MYLLQTGGGGGGFQFVFIGGMILVFWLFFIRPQAKRQKQQKTFAEGLQKGDKVVTIAGIHGKLSRINEDGTIDLEISPGSYLKMERTSISMEMTQNLHKTGTAAVAEKK
ncbi:MAG: preprotein translocase subunit YajC [Chitinophagaceae bacterium]|nr:MAG: preprotein translocase subunit YajC [Chitinophagaceae bacterium]